MRFYADLHVHSKHSRATSRNCDLEHLALWAKRKGIRVVGTGDFTHPAWWQELQENLEPAEPGLYRLKPELERAVDERLPVSCRRPVRFLLEVEISTIYKKGEKTRKVHHLIYAAHFATAGRFRERLDSIGNIRSDGRPILGLDSRHLLEIALESGDDAYLVPAHIWTPWFSAMGSKSGFDSIADCYGDLSEHIFAVETGLSSDPPMNWRVSELDRYTLVSNSDAHSPPMLGREACCFDTELDYFAMRRALETREGWGGTVEFFPEEGKYHLDGHRKCGVRLEPEATRAHDGRCPTCGKAVTVGVLHRVETLADRPAEYEPEEPAPFRSLVPLPEVVSEIRGVGPKSKAVAGTVMALTAKLGPELEILEQLPVEDLARHADPLIAEAVDRLRRGEVRAEGGYDGEFGTIRVFEPEEIVPQLTLASLFGEDFARAAPARSPVPPVAEAAAATATTLAPGLPDAGPSEPPHSSDHDPSILGRLDLDQRRAAEIRQGPLLILAGPGSGKTRTLAHRLAHLVQPEDSSPSDRQTTENKGRFGVPGTPNRAPGSGDGPAAVAADRCLAITFTRRAASELRQRLDALLDDRPLDVSPLDVSPLDVSLDDPAPRPRVSTFHGLGLEILRRHHAELGLPSNPRVADDALRTELLAERLGLARGEVRRRLRSAEEPDADGSAHAGDPDFGDPDAGDPDSGDPGSRLDPTRARSLLAAEGWVHLDDLVRWPVDLFDRRPDLARAERARYDHVAVDEYQDVDEVQYRLLRHLVPADGNLCAIGDPDQAIYGFRGADVRFFLRFREDFPTARVVDLERNYRSQSAIVDAAHALVLPASLVPERRVRAVRRERVAVVLHEAATPSAEAEFVVHSIEEMLGGTSYFSFDSGRVDATSDRLERDLSFDDIAILARTRAQMAPLLEALDRAGMPVQHKGHQRLADDDGVRLLLQILYRRLEEGSLPDEIGPALDAAEADLEPTRREPVRRLLEPLVERSPTLDALLDAVASSAEIDTWDPRAEKISLVTLHAAKGLEFPVVFVVGCDDGLVPLRPPFGPDPRVDTAEERRLLFVGMTRARERLLLTRARRRRARGEWVDTRPSPFLDALPAELLEHRFHAGPERHRAKPRGPEQLSLL